MAGAGEDGTVDRSAFVALFEEHYASLVRLARLLVDDRGSGEEIVQDAFVRVYRRWARIDDPVRYLRTAVVNGARSRLRHRAVVRRYVAPTVRATPAAEDEAVRLAEGAAVMAAVRGLPRRQRECLVRRYYADLSEAEIAATLGIAPGSVKSHSSRGIAAPGRALGGDRRTSSSCATRCTPRSTISTRPPTRSNAWSDGSGCRSVPRNTPRSSSEWRSSSSWR